MKRAVSLLLSAALLLGLLPACREPDSQPSLEPSGLTAKELAEAAYLASGYEGDADVEYLTMEEGGEELLTTYLENAYQLEQPWQDAAVIRATGASAFEIAVLRMADSEAAVRTGTALMSYIFRRQGDFAGYAPAQADMVANGGIRQEDEWAALFICPDPDGADEAFQMALGGEVQPAPEDSPEPSAMPEPTFKLNDLMLRLLVEAACPEWERIDSKSWSDTHNGTDSLTYKWIEEKYGVTLDQYELCDVAYWGVRHPDGHGAWFPDCAYELAAFEVEDEAAGTDLVDLLNRYLAEKEDRLRQEGREDAARLLADGRAVQSGRYVVLIVSDHTNDAVRLFPEAVRSNDTSDYFVRYYQGYRPSVTAPDEDWPDREKFVQPNKDDMSLYDTSAIRAAWAQGDPSGLSDYDRGIYDAAQQILGEILTSGMGDYDKEKAVYAWIVDNVDYDWTHKNILVTTPRESFTPYGGLVNRTAVCLGYAMSFQLLMDLAGVECITVVGAAFSSTGDHAWNMVRLNGEWYCVDVTWDANAREQTGLDWSEEYWIYFNVTSDEMAIEEHQWDYANTPEATAEDRGRG